MVLYNSEILKNVIGGCYATNLSLATPANVKLFQSFLKTAPDPKGEKGAMNLNTTVCLLGMSLHRPSVLILLTILAWTQGVKNMCMYIQYCSGLRYIHDYTYIRTSYFIYVYIF